MYAFEAYRVAWAACFARLVAGVSVVVLNPKSLKDIVKQVRRLPGSTPAIRAD